MASSDRLASRPGGACTVYRTTGRVIQKQVAPIEYGIA